MSMSVLWTSFDEVGLFYFIGHSSMNSLVFFRQDALQRHWDKYCGKRSKRHLNQQATALGSSGPSGMGAVNGMVMSRVVGNGQGVMQEVAGVVGVMDVFPLSRRMGEEWEYDEMERSVYFVCGGG